MSIDLRKADNGRGGTWVLHFKDDAISISLATRSAHVTDSQMGVMFCVDKDEVPAAFAGIGQVDPVLVRKQLHEAICRHMTPALLDEMIRTFHSELLSAYHDGKHAVQSEIRIALGLQPLYGT